MSLHYNITLSNVTESKPAIPPLASTVKNRAEAKNKPAKNMIAIRKAQKNDIQLRVNKKMRPMN